MKKIIIYPTNLLQHNKCFLSPVPRDIIKSITEINAERPTQPIKMKKKDHKQKVEKIRKQTCLTKKCIMTRYLLSPQSTTFETICKQDLLLKQPKNKMSGDASKNGQNYEIKISIHAKNSKLKIGRAHV